MHRNASCGSIGLLALTLTLTLALGVRAEPVLKPVDEAARDPGFFTFRARMLVALAERDFDALRGMIDPGIRTSFGGGGGLAGFEQQWTPRSASSALWRELSTTLALGGTFDEHGNFFAPYVFGRWPDAIDGYDHMVAIGDDVRVRAAADAGSAAIDRLDFEIVALAAGASTDGEWVEVVLQDGRHGFVARRLLRAPLEYRAIFGRVDGHWKLQAFVAGD
jgi:hypothetical protein